MENNKIINVEAENKEQKTSIENQRTVFLKTGAITLSLFLIYESLVYIFLNKLEIIGIILFSFPILPFMIIAGIFNLNAYMMWFLAVISYFLLGGVIGAFIHKIRKN